MQEKKRILLIVPMLDQGGLERVCALTGQLLKDKYDVHIACFNTENMLYDVSGVDLIDLHLGAVPSKVGKIINIFKRAKRLKKIKKELGIQLSYSFGPTANIANVVSRVNDVIWIGIRGYGALEAKKEMRFTCRRADRVISCTRIMEQDINEMYAPKKSATVYNPCDLQTINELASEACSDTAINSFMDKPGKTIVSMGREHDVKGFWHLIKAFSVAKKDINNLKLIIIGAGEYIEYRKLADDLGVSADVLFTGVQKNPFVILKRSDLYVLTSDSEGFPNALIESMACGLPVVSVNCKTGPSEILADKFDSYEDNKKWYDADYGVIAPTFKDSKNMNPTIITEAEKQLASKMVEIMSNEGLQKGYRCKSLKRAADFGMESYVEDMIKLIEKDI